MTRSRLQRPVVLLLIAGGWLSILGNSPPEKVQKKPIGKTGPVIISILRSEWDQACAAEGDLSMPVRKVAMLQGDVVLYELVCADGSDCMGKLRIPLQTSACLSPSRPPPDSARSETPAPVSDGPPADVLPDAPVDSASDATASDGNPDGRSTDAEGPDSGGSDAILVLRQVQQTDAAFSTSELLRCTGLTDGPVEVRQTENKRLRNYSSGDNLCGDESAIYKITVETAAGLQGTYEYKIVVDPPSGYFGCD